MNSLTKRLAALSAIITLGLSGCGTELGGVLYIVGNTVPETSTCLVQAQGGGGQQKFRPSGTMYLSLTDHYRAYLMILNESPQFETVTGFKAEDGRLDQSKIMLDTATVTLYISRTVVETYYAQLSDLAQSMGFSAPIWLDTECDATQCPTTYSIPISVELTSGGTGAAIVDLIPSNYGRVLRHLPFFVEQDGNPAANLIPNSPVALNYGTADLELVMDIQVAGLRHDGVQVSSEPFRYPVKVCNNCLVQNLYLDALAENPLQPVGELEPIEPAEIFENVCEAGSDEVVPNAWCGLMWPKPALANPDEEDPADRCRRERCLTGEGQVSPQGGLEKTLYCPGDGVTFGASTPTVD